MIFELARQRKLSGENKDNKVLILRNYRADSCPLEIDVLKINIFILKTSFLGQIFLLRSSNFISRWFLDRNTLFSNRNLELITT